MAYTAAGDLTPSNALTIIPDSVGKYTLATFKAHLTAANVKKETMAWAALRSGLIPEKLRAVMLLPILSGRQWHSEAEAITWSTLVYSLPVTRYIHSTTGCTNAAAYAKLCWMFCPPQAPMRAMQATNEHLVCSISRARKIRL